MEFRIQRKAIVWYETTVEADNLEEAIENADFGYMNEAGFDWTDDYWSEESEDEDEEDDE
jgi:hypothetical protein